MKAKLLSRVNALIAFVLSLFGFGCVSCVKYGVEPVAEYGCPYATFEAVGKVTDEASNPLQNIRVTVKNTYRQGPPESYTFPETFTDENGNYQVGQYQILYLDAVDVLVDDTSGVYAPDSVRLTVDYDRSSVAKGDHWNNGDGSVHHDFQLKKQ